MTYKLVSDSCIQQEKRIPYELVKLSYFREHHWITKAVYKDKLTNPDFDFDIWVIKEYMGHTFLGFANNILALAFNTCIDIKDLEDPEVGETIVYGAKLTNCIVISTLNLSII